MGILSVEVKHQKEKEIPVTPTSLAPDQAHARLHELTVIDVRTSGEYASGHIAGAHNIPLDHLDTALPVLKSAAGRGELLVVCASGARSAQACATLAAHGIPAATLTGGTTAWSRHGHDLHRPADARAVWPMDRQVRFVAGFLVLTGLAVGQRWAAARWLSVGVAGGLVHSAVSGSCAMARVLARLPLNQPRATDLDATLAVLADSDDLTASGQ